MFKSRHVLIAVGLAACLAVSACNTEAATTDQITQSFKTLTEAQKAELIKQAATMQVQNANDPFHNATDETSTADTVDKYTDVAIKITQALAAGAKEIGVAVNSFLDTPAGKWTLALIVYKTMGTDIMLFASAMFVLIIGLTTIRLLSQRMRTVVIEYDRENKNWFGNYPKLKETIPQFTNDDIWFITIWTAITVVAATVLLINIG